MMITATMHMGAQGISSSGTSSSAIISSGSNFLTSLRTLRAIILFFLHGQLIHVHFPLSITLILSLNLHIH